MKKAWKTSGAAMLMLVGTTFASESHAQERKVEDLAAAIARGIMTRQAPKGDSGKSRATQNPAMRESVESTSASIPGGTVMVRSRSATPGTPYNKGAEAKRVQPFRLDKLEVTVRDYRGCVASGACAEPSYTPKQSVCSDDNGDCSEFDPDAWCNWRSTDRLNHPMNCITLSAAATYCNWRGKRLPTQEEWQQAAESGRRLVYPWGNGPQRKPICLAPSVSESTVEAPTCEVGTKPGDISAQGVRDLAGNVREWTSSFEDVSRGGSTFRFPVVRGGSFRISSPTKASDLEWWDELRSDEVGFRCASSIQP